MGGLGTDEPGQNWVAGRVRQASPLIHASGQTLILCCEPAWGLATPRIKLTFGKNEVGDAFIFATC